MPARASNLVWLWTLLPLLLAAALSIPQLDDDAFTGDEPKSLVVAGRYASGPQTLADVPNEVATRSSEQALGWPMLLFVWGRIAGWSEPAIRLISVLAGMLALALVARVGRDLLAPQVGIIAALLLAASAFFQAYMINARSFTIVAFCALLCIWCYWRIALRPEAAGRAAQAGLLLGAAGMLYMHYAASLLLPAIGLFHLFVTKNRRWWRPVFLLGLAALAASPQLSVFLTGLGRTAGNDRLHDGALTSAGLLAGLLRLMMTHGAIRLTPPPGELPGIVLSLALLAITLLRLRARRKPDAVWLLVFVSVTTVLLLLAVNAQLRFLEITRIRYLMPLLPLTALLAGAGLWRLAGKYRLLTSALLTLWLVSGSLLALTPDNRYGIGFFFRSDVHLAYRFVRNHVPENNVLIIEREIGYRHWSPVFASTLGLPFGYLNLGSEQPLTEIPDDHTTQAWFWLLYSPKDRAAVLDEAYRLGWVRCELALDDWGVTLERHAVSAAYCPASSARLQFDSGIQMSGPDIRLKDGLLRLHVGLHSTDDYLLAHYSMAVHVVDVITGERVAQGDVGIGPGAFVPQGSEIDVNDLPPGDYEVRIALYNWQSGERLSARDLETGMAGDMLPVHSFRIG